MRKISCTPIEGTERLTLLFGIVNRGAKIEQSHNSVSECVRKDFELSDSCSFMSMTHRLSTIKREHEELKRP